MGRALRVVEPDPLPKSHTYRPATDEMNIRVRDYMTDNRISFSTLCETALAEFFQRHPQWPHRTHRFPPGKRPKTA